MNKNGRLCYGVITADVPDMEQREMLLGIIAQAQAQNIDIVVISNIYNPIETTAVLETENCIYDRILSPALDGFILIVESILNPDVRARISQWLFARTDVPLVVAGTLQKEFLLPPHTHINTSDENDIAEITDHLIEAHGLTNIDILSGRTDVDASFRRVEGYRRSLERHGIPFVEEKVHFGDYWTTSGQAFAKKYLSGELPYPQALICCNDYMAYGLLDEFTAQGVDITQKMAVTGYEYVRERHAHLPRLTTCQRSRKALGVTAIKLLSGTMRAEDVEPARCRLISGESCGCGANLSDLRQETADIRTKEMYDFLNLFSQLEHRLTECRNITEFVSCCWEFQFMIRNVSQLYLCLHENWYDNNPDSETMVRYNLRTYEEPAIFRGDAFADFLSGAAAPYYICPLFFSNRLLGYAVVRYDSPDTYEYIFRNWLKAIANALELLRMKNDIRYLAACQSLSEHHDTLTSMYNLVGLRDAYLSAERNGLQMVALRVCLFDTDCSALQTNEKVYAMLDAAEAVRQFCGERGIPARVAQDLFVCLIPGNLDAEFLKRLMRSILCQHTAYLTKYRIGSFACTVVPCEAHTFSEALDTAKAQLQQIIGEISEQRCRKQYREMLKLRNEIYMNPESTFESKKLQLRFEGSPGYLRNLYRQCFSISFHQDCITARIAKACYLLAVTNSSIQKIAFQCGYTDHKYFMRQFTMETGLTAGTFREQIQ